MKNLIACRIASYRKYQERGWSHLPQIGIKHVEVRVPAGDAECQALKQRLADNELSVSSFQGSVEIAKQDVAELVRPQLETAAAFGVHYLFVSVKAGDTDRALVYRRLHQIGDIAAQHDVTVVMETHPDLITNGDVAMQTMRGIDHPRVLVNFDTANVHYYNEGTTTEGELAKVIDHVGAVHLKDSTGVPRAFDFPALGRGIVDFPAIFSMLQAKDFRGPWTMELEGTRGVELDEAAQLQHVADSVAYLRQIGALVD